MPSAVCQKPEPLTVMRCANIVCSQHAPSCIIACCGQIPEKSSEAWVSKESWHVFQVDEAGSYLANHPEGSGPEVSGVIETGMASSFGEGLAGKSGTANVHDICPWASVEITDVVKDREPGETAVLLALQEELLAIGVALDRRDGSMPEEEIGEDAASSTSEQMKAARCVGEQLSAPFMR